MRMLVYKGTNNLGDAIQNVALSRLIGKAKPENISYFTPGEPSEDLVTVAGFIAGPVRLNPKFALFAGICFPSWHKPHADWIGKSPSPIGARDPHTWEHFQKAGVPSEMVGCVTLTLPKYDGPRSGEIFVDAAGPGPQYTHNTPTTLSFDEIWTLAISRLELYQKSALVTTSRIHVAMPCIAMGTPVRYVGPHDFRTSIMKEIGVTTQDTCLPDVSKFREKYIAFLEANLGRKVIESDPVKPGNDA